MTSEQRPPVEHIDHEASVDVVVRRSPRYGRFLIIGAIVGVIAALILTTVFGPSADVEATSAKTFSFGQVFGFIALVCVAAGALLSGLLALVLDPRLGRRARTLDLSALRQFGNDRVNRGIKCHEVAAQTVGHRDRE